MSTLHRLIQALRSWTCPECSCVNNDSADCCAFCLPDDL